MNNRLGLVLLSFLLICVVSEAKSCSYCTYGCCDYYGLCAQSRSQCEYTYCRYCSLSGNCATQSECDNTDVSIGAGVIVGIICAVIAVCLLIFFITKYRQRLRIRKLQQNNQLQAQLNTQNNASMEQSNQGVAVGYAVQTTHQYPSHPEVSVTYSGNIPQTTPQAYGQNPNQQAGQQYQGTIPTGQPVQAFPSGPYANYAHQQQYQAQDYTTAQPQYAQGQPAAYGQPPAAPQPPYNDFYQQGTINAPAPYVPHDEANRAQY